jgi:hypothetical protein
LCQPRAPASYRAIQDIILYRNGRVEAGGDGAFDGLENSRERATPRTGKQDLEVKEGQTPLAAALSFFDEEPDRFRGLRVDAELPDVAAQVQNAELRNAAQQIRSIKAAAGHMSAA